MTKPLLLAMNNPISDDPRYALYPAPVNCAGWRLWRMYHEAREREFGAELAEGVTKVEYRNLFDRRNVLSRREWVVADARTQAARLLSELPGRRVLVLGRATWEALLWGERHHLAPSVLRPGWLEERVLRLWPLGEHQDVSLTAAPHPSGLCHEYNDPEVRRRVGDLMLQMVRESNDGRQDLPTSLLRDAETATDQAQLAGRELPHDSLGA